MSEHFTFIASGGRTGTNFFGDQLRLCLEDCWSEHEPDMFAGFSSLTADRIRRFGLHQVVTGKALGLAGLRMHGTKFLTGAMDLESATATLRQERASYHRDTPAGLLVESYCRWWMFAGHINTIFPGANIIGVVRDPRSWIASWMSHNPRHGYVPWTHYFPPGPVSPARLDDRLNAQRWEQIGPIGRLAWHWNCVNSRLLSAKDSGDTMRIFKFEDLFSGNDKPLEELATFAGSFPDKSYAIKSLEPLRRPKKNASNANADDWMQWAPTERALVDEIAGETMAQCGYEPLSA